MRETASHAGNLLEQAMNMGKSIKPTMRQPPHIGGLDGRKTDVERMTKLISKLKVMEDEIGILVVSLNAGFGLADVPFVGPSVTVTYEESALKRAEEIARELEEEIWDSRDQVKNQYMTPKEVADYSLTFNGHGKPIVIADYSDNPGAGSYGDATNLLKALLEAGV